MNFLPCFSHSPPLGENEFEIAITEHKSLKPQSQSGVRLQIRRCVKLSMACHSSSHCPPPLAEPREREEMNIIKGFVAYAANIEQRIMEITYSLMGRQLCFKVCVFIPLCSLLNVV